MHNNNVIKDERACEKQRKREREKNNWHSSAADLKYYKCIN